MGKNRGYKHFGSYVLRTPAFSYNSVGHCNYSDPLFQEAIYLASSDLFTEIQKAKQNYSEKERETLRKYWSRASTRSTPFGLFATCSVGKIGEFNEIEVKATEDIKRVTLLTSEILYSLSKAVEKKLIDKGLKFYPNDSIYKVDDCIRYVERDGDNLLLQSVNNSNILGQILLCASKGCNMEELLKINVGNYPEGALKNYINELIKNGILISELSPSIYGKDALTQILSVCQKYDKGHKYSNRLKAIRSSLKKIDGSLTHNIIELERVNKNLKGLGVECRGSMIQSDCFRKYEKATLSESIVNNIIDAVDTICGIDRITIPLSLNVFQKEFEKKYGDADVPFLLAMDNELGIGYPVGHISSVNDKILDGIKNIINKKKPVNRHLSGFEMTVLGKMLKVTPNVEEICLTEDDFLERKEKSHKYSMPTISVLCGVYVDEDNTAMIDLKYAGGSSAANLIGRFCHIDKAFTVLSDSIRQKDERPDSAEGVVAEIVHLPDKNLINIIHRPEMRQAFIHYLGFSGNVKGKPISASDLMIRCQGGRLHLFSKDYKEIIPILSNAHNYKMGKSDAYQFLCDYQYYSSCGVSMPTLDNLFEMVEYIPRIKYKNIIISKRRWVVTDGKFDCTIDQWRKMNNIPSKVVIKEYDNELYIDFSEVVDCSVFMKSLKRKKKLLIEEVLFSESNLVVKKGNAKYCSEFIIPLYRSNDV